MEQFRYLRGSENKKNKEKQGAQQEQQQQEQQPVQKAENRFFNFCFYTSQFERELTHTRVNNCQANGVCVCVWGRATHSGRVYTVTGKQKFH
jgi:hypothetical protein